MKVLHPGLAQEKLGEGPYNWLGEIEVGLEVSGQ